MNTLDFNIDAITTSILFGILQSVALIILFLIKGIAKEHKYFTWFIVVLVVIELESFLLRTGLITRFLFLFNISVPLIFLLGPALFTYTQRRLDNKKNSFRQLIHLIPFSFYFLYSFNLFLQPESVKYNAFIRSYRPGSELTPATQTFESDPWDIQGWVVVELISLHLLIYSICGLLTIYRARKNESNSNKIRWLTYINCILLISSLTLFFSQGGIINGYVFFKSPFPAYAPDVWIGIVMYTITLYLIVNPEPFQQNNPKYQKSNLPSEFRKNNLDKIRSLMAEEKPYLDVDFSLEALSQKTGLSKHHISQILNEEKQLSFYEFVHQYRIEEAKQILDSGTAIKIEHLSHQLGYKSKATFFSAFKKITGLSPSQYKERRS